MDHRPNVSLNNSKPSKFLALIALGVAFALPFILVKSFPHKSAFPQVDKSPAFNSNHITSQSILPPPPNFKPIMVVQTSESPISEAKGMPKNNKPGLNTSYWKIIKIRNRDSMATLFKRIGLNAQILQQIMHDNPHTNLLNKLKTDQEVKLLFKQNSLEKMIIPFATTQYLVITHEGNHYKTQIKMRKMDSRNQIMTATIKGSLYETARKQHISYKLIRQMTQIFAWDIDFAKDVRTGDYFTIIYKSLYIDNKQIGTGDIVAISYKNKNTLFQAVRFTNRAGDSDYFTPDGKSLKKAFIRYPLRFSHISSTFSLARYHPILHYTRVHKGIDLAAPLGTPIKATGSGRIEIIGRQNGYGNMIKIRHNKTYSTIYGHMLRFQKGLSKGDFVKREQIIGYVGQTGLASGPHCHYEFHVNNQPKNPTTINLPRGDPISRRELARFKAGTQTLLAQLKLSETRLAQASKTKHQG